MAKRKTYLFCQHCGHASLHTLISSVASDERCCSADGYVHHEPCTYSLFQCGACIGISLYIWSALHLPESEFGERVYPVNDLDNTAIPATVLLAYGEAEKIRFQSTNAYAAMARCVLETIAEEQGIRSSSLFHSMSQLCPEGTTPLYLADAINWLRKTGNEGAHVSKTKLEGVHNDMIASFLQIVVQHFYIFPAELRMFKYLLEPTEEDATD